MRKIGFTAADVKTAEKQSAAPKGKGRKKKQEIIGEPEVNVSGEDMETADDENCNDGDLSGT